MNGILHAFLLLIKCPLAVGIVGGYEAGAGLRPWIAGLRSFEEMSGSVTYCGGSLIHEFYVLTAAHCPRPDQVVLGSHFSHGTDDGEVIAVTNYSSHSRFNHRSFMWDLALLRLERGSSFVPVQLPQGGFDADSVVDVTLFGWGTTLAASNASVEPSYSLQQAHLQVINHTKCQETYRMLNDAGICAFAKGKDMCYGDSGSPLIYTNGDRDILIGVASWSLYGCALEDVPSVYASVKNQMQWIVDSMNAMAPSTWSSQPQQTTLDNHENTHATTRLHSAHIAINLHAN